MSNPLWYLHVHDRMQLYIAVAIALAGQGTLAWTWTNSKQCYLLLLHNSYCMMSILASPWAWTWWQNAHISCYKSSCMMSKLAFSIDMALEGSPQLLCIDVLLHQSWPLVGGMLQKCARECLGEGSIESMKECIRQEEACIEYRGQWLVSWAKKPYMLSCWLVQRGCSCPCGCVKSSFTNVVLALCQTKYMGCAIPCGCVELCQDLARANMFEFYLVAWFLNQYMGMSIPMCQCSDMMEMLLMWLLAFYANAWSLTWWLILWLGPMCQCSDLSWHGYWDVLNIVACS